MMLRRPLLLCLPAAALSCVAAAATPRRLRLVNAVYPPFVNPPGHAQGEGMDIEIAREALRRAGLEVVVELVPWKRALVMLEQGQADLTTTISRTPERERYLWWTQSYRAAAPYHFYIRRGTALAMKSLADLRGRRLGTVGGFFYPDEVLKQPDVQIEPSRDVEALAQKLQAGRLDVMVVTGIRGAWEIREAGLAGTLQKLAYEYPGESTNYMALSRASVDEATVAALRAALDQMVKDGSMAAIERRYLKWLPP